MRPRSPRASRKPALVAGTAIATLLFAFSLFGPIISPYDPDEADYSNTLAPPGAEHPLGTDHIGRDVFARIADGARRSLGSAVLILALVVSIGIAIGVAAGLAGGWGEIVIMRVVDIALALPGTVLAIAIAGLLGPGFKNLILAMVIADWAYYARLARSFVLTAAKRPDVLAARMAGVPSFRIVMSHILPSVVSQMAAVATLGLGGMIAAISGFSFIGLGIQPPLAEWGNMLSESRYYITIAPWLLIAPTAMVFLSVLTANLLGNALRDSSDPGTQNA